MRYPSTFYEKCLLLNAYNDKNIKILIINN